MKETADHDQEDLKKYDNRKAAEVHTKKLEEAVETGTDILQVSRGPAQGGLCSCSGKPSSSEVFGAAILNHVFYR